MDDRRAARRTDAGQQPAAVGLEHQCRAHARAWPFARLDAIGHRFALGVTRLEGEVGELVVQQVAARQPGAAVVEQARAEGLFDGGGHRQRVAVGVDDADVAGAVLRLLGLRREGQRQRPRVARFGGAHAGRADQAGTLLQVARGQQRIPVAARRRGEVRVGQVLRAVGIGQARRLGVAVQEVGGRQALLERCQRPQLLQQAEDLHLGHVSRGGRREAADSVTLLPQGTDGVALARLIAIQVAERQPPRIARVSIHLLHQRLGVFALIESGAAVFGDLAQQRGEGGIAQPMADWPGVAVGLVIEGRGLWIVTQGRVVLQQAMQARAHRETVVGEADGGLEQRFPGQLAVLPVRLFEHLHRAGHAYRTAADHCLLEIHRRAVRLQEQCFVGGGRSRLAAVQGDHALTVPVQQKGAATDPAGLRLDQGQHHLHGHGGIQRAAARLEDFITGLGRQRVGRRHGEALGGPAGFSGIAGSGFGKSGYRHFRFGTLAGRHAQ